MIESEDEPANQLQLVADSSALFNWFGYWPTFHDAEVTEIFISRSAPSVLKIHTWHTADHVDGKGLFVREKDVVVQFEMLEVVDLSLVGFNHQNVIAGIRIHEVGEGLCVELEPSYGVSGTIVANEVRLTLIPDLPCAFG